MQGFTPLAARMSSLHVATIGFGFNLRALFETQNNSCMETVRLNTLVLKKTSVCAMAITDEVVWATKRLYLDNQATMAWFYSLILAL
jgi:hypothetical protein